MFNRIIPGPVLCTIILFGDQNFNSAFPVLMKRQLESVFAAQRDVLSRGLDDNVFISESSA